MSKVKLIAATSALLCGVTFADSGHTGHAEGASGTARFSYPFGVAVDSVGNIYVADSSSNLISKITSAGVITTLAGSGERADWADGTGAAASFDSPSGLAVDTTGNVYVADSANNMIRKVTPKGVVTTLAGRSGAGREDGDGWSARFSAPAGAAVDAAGNVYVSDVDSGLIRKVTPKGVVTTLAGTGNYGRTDGVGAAASFRAPWGVAVDTASNVYVADSSNNLIRKITPAGLVTTIAGSGKVGYADGIGVAASFDHPDGVAVDTSGNIYVTDYGNNLVRKITAAGAVRTLAGNRAGGSADGIGTAASFFRPEGIAVDTAGNVYVADANNKVIRKINPAGGVSTLAPVRGSRDSASPGQ